MSNQTKQNKSVVTKPTEVTKPTVVSSQPKLDLTKPLNIADTIQLLILNGLENQAILKQVKLAFPTCQTTMNSIHFYRSRLKNHPDYTRSSGSGTILTSTLLANYPGLKQFDLTKTK